MHKLVPLLVTCAAFAGAASPVWAQNHPPLAGQRQPAVAGQSRQPSVYAPYALLIGEWSIVTADGAPVGVSRFTWGPGNSYIWFATSILSNGRDEPHFEGILVWNGVNRNLDMLISVDLAGGRVQEQGTLFVAPDGTIVREHAAIYSEGQLLPTGASNRVGPQGATVNFRQTFQNASSDRITTRLTRQDPSGWVPTFPGADNLTMIRRPLTQSGATHR